MFYLFLNSHRYYASSVTNYIGQLHLGLVRYREGSGKIESSLRLELAGTKPEDDNVTSHADYLRQIYVSEEADMPHIRATMSLNAAQYLMHTSCIKQNSDFKMTNVDINCFCAVKKGLEC